MVAKEHISMLKQNFKQPTRKVLQIAHVKACLYDLHNKYVFMPTDIQLKTILQSYVKGSCSTPTGNSTYTLCQMSSKGIVSTHNTLMKSPGC